MKPVLACLLLASLLGGSAFATPAPSDEGVPLLIDVRSSVDQRWQGLRKGGAISHGKLYLLASVKDTTASESPLVKPLDEVTMVRLLRAQLGARGFREFTAQELPEIVLTVTYGRGFLRNPHVEPGTIDEISPGIPTATIISLKQAFKQREPGFEMKAQRAQAEKLFLTVTAWKYPATKGEKPYLFWRTVMVTDNPDERDLNLALPAMLAAGGSWFDRETKEGEVTVNSTMPAGTVKLGPLEVIEAGK